MIQFLEFQKHVKVWSDDLVSWKPNSFDLGSDVPELVPSVSDMIVDSEYFADLTNILWDMQKKSSPLC